MIPLCDLKRQHLALQAEIDGALRSVAASGSYILGHHVQRLEQDIAALCQTPYAVGVANGTDALHLALRALQIGSDDEVITTPFTFIASAEAIAMVGASPVFVDIDPRSLNLDVSQIEAAITPRTKAVLPVHLFGQPCEMDGILDIARRHGLFVIEDCAQSIGASYRRRPVGGLGDVGCFSFFPSKNLGCMGDGGMVVTRHREVFERVEMLRRHGGRAKYVHQVMGVNSRLDELQAAVLRVKLPHLGWWNQQRRRWAYHYNQALRTARQVATPAEWNGAGYVLPTPGEPANPLLCAVYHQYTIQVEDRSVLCERLAKAGIGNAVYYPVPLHLQPVHEPLGHRRGDFPCAEQAAQRCLSLPMFPELTDREIEKVVDVVLEATSSKQRSLSADQAASLHAA